MIHQHSLIVVMISIAASAAAPVNELPSGKSANFSKRLLTLVNVYCLQKIDFRAFGVRRIIFWLHAVMKNFM